MVTMLQYHVSELIAGLAVLISALTTWHAVRAGRAAQKAKKAARRMDMLVEIEQKNAAVGKLTLVTAQKIFFLHQHPNVIHSQEEELERLRKNLKRLQDFKQNENEQRQIAEAANGGSDIELHSKALTDVRRLRLRIEADIEKETAAYDHLLSIGRHRETHVTL